MLSEILAADFSGSKNNRFGKSDGLDGEKTASFADFFQEMSSDLTRSKSGLENDSELSSICQQGLKELEPVLMDEALVVDINQQIWQFATDNILDSEISQQLMVCEIAEQNEYLSGGSRETTEEAATIEILQDFTTDSICSSRITDESESVIEQQHSTPLKHQLADHSNDSASTDDPEPATLPLVPASFLAQQTASFAMPLPVGGFSVINHEDESAEALQVAETLVTSDLEPIIQQTGQVVNRELYTSPKLANSSFSEALTTSVSVHPTKGVQPSSPHTREFLSGAEGVSALNLASSKPWKLVLRDNESFFRSKIESQLAKLAAKEVITAPEFSINIDNFTFLPKQIGAETLEIRQVIGTMPATQLQKLPTEHQIAMSLDYAIANGKSEILVNLHPQSLGAIAIKLEFIHDGSKSSQLVGAVIASENPVTLKLLESSKDQIEALLFEKVNNRQNSFADLEKTNTDAATTGNDQNHGHGQKQESYFASYEERENWMNKFRGLVAIDDVSSSDTDKLQSKVTITSSRNLQGINLKI